MRQLSSLCLLAGILIPVAWQGAARAEPKYTQHPPHAGRTETIVVYLDPRFADGDRGDIVSAIDEWNVALNGVMKFEAVPLPPARSPALSISAPQPASPGSIPSATAGAWRRGVA